MTLSFVCALFFISAVDAPAARRGRMHWTTCVGMALALALAVTVEATARMPSSAASPSMQHATNSWLEYYLRLHPLFGAPMVPMTAHLTNHSSSNVLVDPDSETQAALLLAQTGSPPLWPFLIFSAVSPVLLRAGGGSVYVGGLYHSMTPVQTLETGIPITILLAGLVLSWYIHYDPYVFVKVIPPLLSRKF